MCKHIGEKIFTFYTRKVRLLGPIHKVQTMNIIWTIEVKKASTWVDALSMEILLVLECSKTLLVIIFPMYRIYRPFG